MRNLQATALMRDSRAQDMSFEIVDMSLEERSKYRRMLAGNLSNTPSAPKLSRTSSRRFCSYSISVSTRAFESISSSLLAEVAFLGAGASNPFFLTARCAHTRRRAGRDAGPTK